MYNLCGRTVQFRRFDCSIWAVALFNSKRSGCSTLAEYSTFHLSFFLNVYGGSSCILDSSSDEATLSEEDGSSLFSYTGTDIYNDKINIIYSSEDKTLTVTSINELSGGTTNYDLPCSGTYKKK